jgi:hypothetical protein
MNPVRNIASFFFKTRINVILLFMTEDFQAVLSLPFRFAHQILAHFAPAICAPHFLPFHHP